MSASKIKLASLSVVDVIVTVDEETIRLFEGDEKFKGNILGYI